MTLKAPRTNAEHHGKSVPKPLQPLKTWTSRRCSTVFILMQTHTTLLWRRFREIAGLVELLSTAYRNLWFECFVVIIFMHYVAQVLESFKIMDYSLLLGIHVLDRKMRGRGGRGDSKRQGGQKVLYSTALESIQGDGKAAEVLADTDDDSWVLGEFGCWKSRK